MDSEKSQGPRWTAVAGGVVLLCALLAGAAYYFRDGGESDAAGAAVADPREQPPATTGWTAADAVAAARLEPLVSRCEEGSSEDAGSGRTKTRCTAKAHPAFMLEVIGKGDEVERASLMVPMRGDIDKLRDRILLGVELFSLVAGTQPDSFLSKEYLDAIGTTPTTAVFQGRVYMTKPVASVGLIFGVMPEPLDSPSEN